MVLPELSFKLRNYGYKQPHPEGATQGTWDSVCSMIAIILFDLVSDQNKYIESNTQMGIIDHSYYTLFNILLLLIVAFCCLVLLLSESIVYALLIITF